MKNQVTIKNHLDAARQHKIRAAAHFFFKQEGVAFYKEYSFSKENALKPSNVNYYFNDAKGIFNKLKIKNTAVFFEQIEPILNDFNTDGVQKMEQLVVSYLNLLFEKPDFAVYVMDELLKDFSAAESNFAGMWPVADSLFIKQLEGLKGRGKIRKNPVQFMVNLVGMVLLPIVVRDQDSLSAPFSNDDFNLLIDERKKFLSLWISSMSQ